MFGFKKLLSIPSREEALPGRPTPIPTAKQHFVNGNPLKGPIRRGTRPRCSASAASGAPSASSGSSATASTYRGGLCRRASRPTRPTRRSARAGPATTRWCWWCSTRRRSRYEELLKTFWESHDPTQGMRQGNDVGTQYRSGIYVTTPAQRKAAEASKAMYDKALAARRLRRRSRPRSSTRRRSISPRTITSSISPRTRWAIAGWAAPACPARSGPASASRRADGASMIAGPRVRR